MLRVTVLLELQEEKGAAILAEMDHRAQAAVVCVLIAHQAARPIRAVALIRLCLDFVLRVAARRLDLYRHNMELPAAEVEVAETILVRHAVVQPAVTADPG
jgi:hypothetical protein